MDYSQNFSQRLGEWFRYYSEKRIVHQWLQVHLLKDLKNVHSILEIGPGLGLVSAMLHNVGFKVTTLDHLPSQYPHPDINSIRIGLENISSEDIRGFDCILCCETLEHLHWKDLNKILEKFFKSKVTWVVISVPYQGFQGDFRIYFNRYTFRKAFSIKYFKFLKKFRFNAKADPYGHKWEIGYRGHSLKNFEKAIRMTGFKIHKREFSTPCRSVFFVLQNS